MRRVFLLITQLEPAGAQRVALALAADLHARGWGVTVGFFYDKVGGLDALAERSPFEVVCLARRRPGPIRAAVALVRLYSRLRRGRPDVFLSFTHWSNVLGAPLAWLARVPLRLVSQRNSLRGYGRTLFRLDAAIVNRGAAHAMLAVSEATARFCVEHEGMAPERVHVIPNGVDVDALAATADRDELRRKLDLDPEAPVAITVARLHSDKGHRDLLRAVPRIREAHPDFTLLLVGDGEERRALEVACAALDPGAARCVRWLGRRDDVPDLLAASDLAILPTLCEGMPNAVLEAMAAGLPVLATDVDGVAEVVEEGATGVLVPPGRPGALARETIALLADGARRDRLGAAGRARVEAHFSQDEMLARYRETFERELAESSGTSSETGGASRNARK